MFLSVVTVHFREFKGLGETLESLRNIKAVQGFQMIEWIVIDGGSDFSAHEELRAEIEREASVFVSEPDAGLYDAMNKGLALCRGKYVIFMNAGDVFTSEFKLKELQDVCDELSPVMVWGASYEGLPGEVPMSKQPRGVASLWYGMPTHHQAILMRTNEAREFKYDLSLKIASDFKLVCELSKLPNSKIAIVKNNLCVFELGGVSTTKFWLGLREQQRVRKDVLGVSFFMNGLIFGLKSFNRLARGTFPRVYNIIRYVKAK